MTADGAIAPPWRVGHAVRQTLHFCRAWALPLLAIQAPYALGAVALAVVTAAGSWPLLVVTLIAVLAATLWAQATSLLLALDFWSGRPVSLAAAARVAWRRLLPFAWTGLLVALGTFVGLALMVAPGVVFAVRYGPLAGIVPLVEPLSGPAALRRGRALLSGTEWRAAATLVALAAVALLLTVGVAVVEGFARGIDTPFLGGTVAPIAMLMTIAISALWAPALAAFEAWLYTRCSGLEPRAADAEPVHAGGAALVATGVTLVALAVVDGRTLSTVVWAPSGAMAPTIAIGDHFYVDTAAYDLREPIWGTVMLRRADPQRGDVIVVRSPADGTTDLVKRVVAIGGDRVAVRGKQLLVNGEVVAEPYAAFSDPIVTLGQRDQMAEITLGSGDLFLLGDNRDRSYDSRFWGPGRRGDVRGRATWIYWSRDPEGGEIRWRRIGQRLDQ